MLLALWGYIEADFLREYGMHLAEELPRMGWHEFRNLLRGLSPDSALHRHWREIPQSGRQAASAFWQAINSAGKET